MALEIEAWVQMVSRVDPLIVAWFGIVNGVRVPSEFSRIIEMCSPVRTTRNPRSSKARMTRVSERPLEISAFGLNVCFGHISVKYGGLTVKNLPAEGLYVKTYSRLHI